MIANNHTHTYRCSHATGNDEEYIKRAIDGGIKILGFSDHAPFPLCKDKNNCWWRIQVEDAEEYVSSIKALREKYRDEITIYIGFEMEYYPKYFKEMLNYVKSLGAEYLIMGQHYYAGEENGEASHSAGSFHDEKQLTVYTDIVIEGMRTGKYSYVAHPDMLKYSGDKSHYEKEAKRLCEASLKLDIPLELNLLGIFGNRHYPNEAFLEVAGQVGCKMIFGFDAHDPQRAYDEKSLVKAQALVEKYNINLIDTINLKKP